MKWGFAVKIPTNTFFYDFDTKQCSIKDLIRLTEWCHLGYGTGRGYHFFFDDNTPLKYYRELALDYIDPDCPMSSVRIYPDKDFNLLNHRPGNTFIDWLAFIHNWSQKKPLRQTFEVKPYVNPK